MWGGVVRKELRGWTRVPKRTSGDVGKDLHVRRLIQNKWMIKCKIEGKTSLETSFMV